jgi:predicted metal-dependent peptidase
MKRSPGRAGPIEIKLAAARTRLILEKPFIGALVMHLPLRRAGAWCATIATDARTIYYNPPYIERLGFAETQFVVAHAAMHCALGHFARRGHRVLARWDIATDYAVNQILVDEGMKPPAGVLLDPAFRGLAAEEIYPLLPAECDQGTLDRHIADPLQSESEGRAGNPGARSLRPGSPRPVGEAAPDHGPIDTWDDAGNERRHHPGAAPLPPAPARAEVEALAASWQSRLALAAQHARRAGRMSAATLRLVDTLLRPHVPWRALLARYLANLARDDYSYARPSRREGAALLPRLASGEADVCVALDTSGSISERELGEFTAEVDAVKAQVRARVTLLACDQALDARGPWNFEPWQQVVLPAALGGGGGTSFVPVFEWIAQEHRRPDVLLYFTDAEGDFPDRAPDYPVLWLVKGRARVPWGDRIQLN